LYTSLTVFSREKYKFFGSLKSTVNFPHLDSLRIKQ
jgi:hypothetical protein